MIFTLAIFTSNDEDIEFENKHRYHDADYCDGICEQDFDLSSMSLSGIEYVSDVKIVSEEEFFNLINEYLNITSDEERREYFDKYFEPYEYTTPNWMYNEELRKFVLDCYLDCYEDDIKSLSGCNHIFDTKVCTQHFIIGPCYVLCYARITCGICGESYMQIDQHDNHSWSTGWCGRTCTACGRVEIFHPPGGCWFCS